MYIRNRVYRKFTVKIRFTHINIDTLLASPADRFETNACGINQRGYKWKNIASGPRCLYGARFAPVLPIALGCVTRTHFVRSRPDTRNILRALINDSNGCT